MKLHLAAICFNEKELETYVSQLKTQGFETLSEVKMAEDGTFYQAMTKSVKAEISVIEREKVSDELSLVS